MGKENFLDPSIWAELKEYSDPHSDGLAKDLDGLAPLTNDGPLNENNILGSDSTDVIIGRSKDPTTRILSIESLGRGREVFTGTRAIVFLDRRNTAKIFLIANGRLSIRCRPNISAIETLDDSPQHNDTIY